MADVAGIGDLRSSISSGIVRQRQKLLADLDALGARMVAEIREAAPKKTGAMAASVRYEGAQTDNGVSLRISVGGESAFYAPYVEFGTSHAPAHSFVRPVVHQEEKRIPGRCENTVYDSWDFS